MSSSLAQLVLCYAFSFAVYSVCFHCAGWVKICTRLVTSDRRWLQPWRGQGHFRHWCWRCLQQCCRGHKGVPANPGRVCCQVGGLSFVMLNQLLIFHHVYLVVLLRCQVTCLLTLRTATFKENCLKPKCSAVQLGGYNQQAGQAINDGLNKTKEYLPNQVIHDSSKALFCSNIHCMSCTHLHCCDVYRAINMCT